MRSTDRAFSAGSTVSSFGCIAGGIDGREATAQADDGVPGPGLTGAERRRITGADPHGDTEGRGDVRRPAGVVGVHVGQRVRGDRVAGQRPDELLAVRRDPRVDQDVPEDVRVDPVTRREGDGVGPLGELLHGAHPTETG